MPALSPGEWMTLLGMVVVAVSAFIAVREGGKQTSEAVQRLDQRQARDNEETHRLVKALHVRFDKVENRVAKVEEIAARHDERIKALRDTQRFRLRANIEGPTGSGDVE